jgi:hypothetical protein
VLSSYPNTLRYDFYYRTRSIFRGRPSKTTRLSAVHGLRRAVPQAVSPGPGAGGATENATRAGATIGFENAAPATLSVQFTERRFGPDGHRCKGRPAHADPAQAVLSLKLLRAGHPAVTYQCFMSKDLTLKVDTLHK